jgi:hypothetical protein
MKCAATPVCYLIDSSSSVLQADAAWVLCCHKNLGALALGAPEGAVEVDLRAPTAIAYSDVREHVGWYPHVGAQAPRRHLPPAACAPLSCLRLDNYKSRERLSRKCKLGAYWGL